MRSLVLSRWAPDRSDGGAAMRNAQNCAALARLGPVDVITIGPAEEAHPVMGVADWRHFTPMPRRPLPGAWIFGGHPITIRDRQPEAAAYMRGLQRGRYDFALVEEIALADYLGPLRAVGMPTVFDAHNVEARLRDEMAEAGQVHPPLRQRLRRHLLGRRLQAIEARAVAEATAVWACSAIDAALLTHLYRPPRPVEVVPNAIRLENYEAARAAQLEGPRRDTEPVLIYAGTYSYAPNEAAALRLITRILPALRARGWALRLALVGRDPTPAMHAAAKTDFAIEITGAVESVLPWLSTPCVVALPITLGSGTRLKILEAFAAGCPVVSTAKGAEGIEAEPGRDLLIAESDADFATALAWLASDPAARRSLGAAGHRVVRERYSWQAAADAVAAALEGLAP